MKKRKTLSSELGPGVDQVKIGGKLHNRKVYEKMGADGVIETHIEHTEYKKPTVNWGRVHSKYCGGCNKWVIENKKPKPHGKNCKYL